MQRASPLLTLSQQIEYGGERSITWHRRRLSTVGGYTLLGYFALVLVYRYSLRGLAGALDMLWGCNFALLVAAYGMLARQASAISGAVAMVAMAHFLWYYHPLQFLTDLCEDSRRGEFPCDGSFPIWFGFLSGVAEHRSV